MNTDYLYADARPISVLEPGASPAANQVNYILADRLGTPQHAFNSIGASVWTTTYQPYGETGTVSGSITQNLRLPGQHFDAETGFHYNLNRDYMPNVGRYLEADGLGLAAGANLFAFAKNNPALFVDPTGFAPDFFGFGTREGFNGVPTSSIEHMSGNPGRPPDPPLTANQVAELLDDLSTGSLGVGIAAAILENIPWGLAALGVGLCSEGIERIVRDGSVGQYAASTSIDYGIKAAGADGVGVTVDMGKFFFQLSKVLHFP